MASCVHGTLTADIVTEKTVNTGNSKVLEIVNRTQSGELWVRLDKVDPVIGADDCFVVLGSRSFEVGARDVITVRMIASTAIKYSIEGRVNTK